jgi:hypothetical protein
MPIEISTQIIHNSFATVINKIQPGANIYDNPNQQGTTYPAWFIVHRSPVELQRHVGKRKDGNRYLITFQIDLWYMLQQNITRLFDQYTAIAEQLAYNLQYLPIFGSDAVVQVYDQSWSLELNALKYSTTIKLRVYTDEDFVFTPMEVITDLETFIKGQNEAVVSFANTEHPEFDAEFPKAISVTTGRRIALPVVSGTFEDDTYLWTPSRWTIGEFGELITVNESVETDLEWVSTSKTATVTYTNTDHPDFDVTLPEPSVVNVGESIALPSVSGEHIEEPYVWRTTAWDIGNFGESITVNENITSNVLWERSKIAVVRNAYFNPAHTDAYLPSSDYRNYNLCDEQGKDPIYYDNSKTYRIIGLYLRNGTSLEYDEAWFEPYRYGSGYILFFYVRGLKSDRLSRIEYEEM